MNLDSSLAGKIKIIDFEIEGNNNNKISEYKKLKEEVEEIENMENWDEDASEFYLDFLRELGEGIGDVETYRDKNTGKCRFRYKVE